MKGDRSSIPSSYAGYKHCSNRRQLHLISAGLFCCAFCFTNWDVQNNTVLTHNNRIKSVTTATSIINNTGSTTLTNVTNINSILHENRSVVPTTFMTPMEGHNQSHAGDHATLPMAPTIISDQETSSLAASIRHTPMDMDLLSWENKSMHEFHNVTRGGKVLTYPVCQPPDGIHATCCLGSIASRDGMIRYLANTCFQNGPEPYNKVEKAARRELEQTASLLLDGKDVDDSPFYFRDCDICRVIEIIYRHDLKFLVVGDSVMLQTFSGLICELSRRGYKVAENTTYFTKYVDVVGVRGMSTIDVSGPEHWSNKTVRVTYLSQYKPKPDMSEISEMASEYDIVMMNFGLHWNWPDRKKYEDSMATLFNATKGGKIQLLAHRETSAQHFNATAGAFVRGIGTTCVPLPTGNSSLSGSDQYRWKENAIHAGAAQAGYKVVVATDKSLARPKTENVDEDELVILPFYSFTAELFDLHPNECTHFCSTPFLWLPVWRSLRLAMDRQWTIE